MGEMAPKCWEIICKLCLLSSLAHMTTGVLTRPYWVHVPQLPGRQGCWGCRRCWGRWKRRGATVSGGAEGLGGTGVLRCQDRWECDTCWCAQVTYGATPAGVQGRATAPAQAVVRGWLILKERPEQMLVVASQAWCGRLYKGNEKEEEEIQWRKGCEFPQSVSLGCWGLGQSVPLALGKMKGGSNWGTGVSQGPQGGYHRAGSALVSCGQ